jgi:branched-subunit amino acid ABC-type transport system permease component
VRNLLPFLVAGLVTGSLYGLAGLGLVLTYRTSGVLNLGHGAIAAAAAFVFYSLYHEQGLPWPVAAAIVLVTIGVLGGLLLERVTRSLGDVPVAIVIVATAGVLLAVNGILALQYGHASRNFPDFLPTSGFTVFDVNITWAQVISSVIAVGSAVGLYLFLQRSKLGVAMRAVVDDRSLVALTGMRPTRVRGAAWVIGNTFAALSGILIAPGLGLDSIVLTLLVVQAFGACAIGRFTSLPLTFVGGLVVGVLSSVATRYLTDPPLNALPSTVPYLIVIVVLLAVHPKKLPQIGSGVRSLAAAPSPVDRRVMIGVLVTGGVGLLFVPALVGPKLPVWINALIYVVVFGSLALLVWLSGQISLCHMAFAAFGATTFSHLTLDWKVPWGVALLLTGLATVPAGALVAIPAIRTSGIYLALLTLGFGIFLQNVVYPTEFMFGGDIFAKAPRPVLGFIDGYDDRHLYFIVLAIAVAACLFLVAVTHSQLGRFLRAMSETPTLLSTYGLGVNVTRLLVFCLSAFMAGIAGALFVTQAGAASGVGFGPIQSLVLLAVLTVCGTRVLPSTLLAATLLAIVPGYVSDFGVDQQVTVFGLTAVTAAILIAQRGPLGRWLGMAAATTDSRRVTGPVQSRSAEETFVTPVGEDPPPMAARLASAVVHE